MAGHSDGFGAVPGCARKGRAPVHADGQGVEAAFGEGDGGQGLRRCVRRANLR